MTALASGTTFPGGTLFEASAILKALRRSVNEPISTETATIAFDAVRQFIVRPDRYYRVELRPSALHFARSGTQFDLARGGSVGRHQMKSASSSAGFEMPGWATKATRGPVMAAGIGIITVSSVLIAVSFMAGWVIGYFFAAWVFGFVVVGAGFVTPTAAEARAKDADFALPFSRIQTATLNFPEKANMVARLEIKTLSEGTITLTVNTPADLETVRERLLPALGKKARIA